MSGDVQPRKRKDKKKRKEDDGYSALNDDVNIHVHKEGGTGGNICAKIVFFLLFSALIVLIGLIIKENQGLTELEDIEQESRYSQIFEGWVDNHHDAHGDNHDDKLSQEHDDNDLEEDDHDQYEHEESINETEEQSEEADHDEDQEDEEESTVSSEEQSLTDRSEEDDSTLRSREEDSTIESEEEDSTLRSGEETEEEEQLTESEEDNQTESNEVDDKTEEEEEHSESQEIDQKEIIISISKEKKKYFINLNNKDHVDDDDDDNDDDDDDDATETEKSGEENRMITKDDDSSKDIKSEEMDEGPKATDVKEDNEQKKDEETEKEAPAEEISNKSSGNVNVGQEMGSDSEKKDDKHDYNINIDIEAAEKQLPKENAAYANKLFDALLNKHSFSPRILYGKAQALDLLAEEKKSNELLEQAIEYYMKAINVPNIPDSLFVTAGERYINRTRFLGHYSKAIAVHRQLIERFPDNPKYLNNLAVTYLTVNLIEEARSVLKKVLKKWPNNGFALVHYGFLLKTSDNNLKESVDFMDKGLKTKEPGVTDGRFYLHLGDALTRLNRNEQAAKLYEEGVKEKLFPSKYQRSLYNVPRLTAKPWWEPSHLPAYQKLFLALKNNWQAIRKEGLAAITDKEYFRDEAENLKDMGTWKQFELFARGLKFTKNCAKSPITCGIIQQFPEARSCRRGQTKFSILYPATHVWPHCGPTNCRLRIHLGLKVPNNTFIRVAEETRSWIEGEIIIFDDSFEHEVWHNGSKFRLVLIVDVWHPELTSAERKTLSSI